MDDEDQHDFDDDVADEDWIAPVHKRPKRRMSCYASNQKKGKQFTNGDDRFIPKERPRRKSCYYSNRKEESEDDEPITIDKVLGFLNGDDDLIKFSRSSPIPNEEVVPKAKDLDNDARGGTSSPKERRNNDKKSSSDVKDSRNRHIDAKQSPSHLIDLDSDAKEKPELDDSVELLDIDEDSQDTSTGDRYDINVSVDINEVKQEDKPLEEFDDTASETIELPEIPPSDEDEDLSGSFGENKPIITSVTSLRPNGMPVNSERFNSKALYSQRFNNTSFHMVRRNSHRSYSEELDVVTVDENGEKGLLEDRKPRNKNTYKKVYTHDRTTVVERHGHLLTPQYGNLLTPIRSEPIYEPRVKRTTRRRRLYEDEDYTSPTRRGKTKCKHCGGFFHREDLDKHLSEVASAKNKIIDKLLQIPVVKIIDVAKDDNLDPKLKARLKDLKFKMENKSANYTLRHCVHCEKAFVTSRQFNNHIVDVIFGLKVLKCKDKLMDYRLKLQTNNYDDVR